MAAAHERVALVAMEAHRRGERMRPAVAAVFNISEAAAGKRLTKARQAGYAIPKDPPIATKASYTWAQFLYDIGANDREFDPMEWRDRANCRSVNTSLFFPERGVSVEQARQVCQGCEVREDCLDYALENNERHGIWGGLSERQRRMMRRETRDNVVRYLTGTKLL